MLNVPGRDGTGGWGRDLERQQVIGIEARRDTVEIEQVRDEDGGRRQQGEGERDFTDDECVREPPASSTGGCAHAVAERVSGYGANRLPERGHAGQRGGEQRTPAGEEQHRPIEGNLVGAWDVLSGQRNHGADERRTDQHAGRRADEGDDQPLHEVVKGEAPLRRAERDANGGFPCSRHGARQQQPGDVRAGDEQQHSRSNHQQQQRGLDFQKNRLPQIVDAGGVRRVRCAVECRNLGGHALDVRLGLRERHAGLEPGVAEVQSHRSILAPAQRIESDPDFALDPLDAGSGHWQAEPWRRHAADREGAAVERQRLTDDA